MPEEHSFPIGALAAALTGDLDSALTDTPLTLRLAIPRHKFVSTAGDQKDPSSSPHPFFPVNRVPAGNTPTDLQVEGSGPFRAQVPAESVLGDDWALAARWLSSVAWDDLTLEIPYQVADASRLVLASGRLDALFYFDQIARPGSPSSHLIRPEVGDPQLDSAGRDTLMHDASARANLPAALSLFLINAPAYREFAASHPASPGTSDGYLLPIIRDLGVFSSTSNRPENLTDDQLASYAEARKLNVDVVRDVVREWDLLTRFPVEVPDSTPITAAGTFALRHPDGLPISRSELGLHRVTADVPVTGLDGGERSVSLDVAYSSLEDPVALPAPFTLQRKDPVLRSSARGPVAVRVTGFDGRVMWSERYEVDDPDLQQLEISLDLRLPDGPGTGPSGPRPSADRKLRGKVVAVNSAQQVSGLTVIVQARDEGGAEDAPWRIIASAETTGEGFFSLPYPHGRYSAAQALVSVGPDSPVDLRIIGDGGPDATLADDFIYILLTPAESGDKDCGCEGGAGCGGGSGCGGCAHAPGRLPDQADLIASGEYSQDLGGGCVNVTTPNRALREFTYNAIVRTSDPEIERYALRKRAGSGFRADDHYELVTDANDGAPALPGFIWGRPLVYPLWPREPAEPTSSIRERHPVGRTNPIRWQDSPDSGTELNFYQSLTVATGHVLFYRSVFKADGYSLGDLVYSLPLAPGQKKQIVSYDMANSLEASESQEIEQSERLAADLMDDRFITDQLGGSINEDISGRSNASTAGISAGLGLGGSMGPIGGSLGVAGGYSNSKSSASQSGARNIAQHFGEKLRQSLTQNAESYRRLNASVVTTVKDGQEYAVTTEVVANHNHCHSMTMMYFEVLRHYAISQELTGVQECLFIPLQLTEFTPGNISKWKDVLAPNLLAKPSNTYLPVFRLLGSRRHPLVGAFDAVERRRTDYGRVDFPDRRYADDAIVSVTGSARLRVQFPRPRTRADRIKSLPLITETVREGGVNAFKAFIGGMFLGPAGHLLGLETREREVEAHLDVSDHFLTLDANFERVPPAQSIRVTNFRPWRLPDTPADVDPLDFFGNQTDRERWEAYAEVLGRASAEDLLEEYFQDRLIAEWDEIFERDIAPQLYTKLTESLRFLGDFSGSGLPALDVTKTAEYHGGRRDMTIRLRTGATGGSRADLADELRMVCTDPDLRALHSFVTVTAQHLDLSYRTDHFSGPIIRASLGDDLLDGVRIPIPLNSNDKRNPRKEDYYLAQELIEHLNSNIEYYNRVLWRELDEGRRHMLLDGFNIETFTPEGASDGERSLASVVKNELLTVVGNSMVFPVADGFHVDRGLAVAAEGTGEEQEEVDYAEILMKRYQPLTPLPPYRLSVPTRGVYSEAVMGVCDSCEDVKENSSQDWDEFRTDEPTAINPVSTPTPARADWKAIWAQFSQPLVAMQTPRDAPAPGAGLAGLSDALTNAEAFRDITGLAGNQENAIRTYLSNQENARAFAEMAKGMAMQETNAENSRGIMQSLEQARDAGALPENDYQQLVRDHLGQMIDGGSRASAEQRRATRQDPSLTNAAIDAAEAGHSVSATRVDPSGTNETLEVRPSGTTSSFAPVYYDVPLVAQPNKTACWAASMAMLESYRRSQAEQASVVLSAAALADEVGYSLEQSYGWDRLQDVADYLGLRDIALSGQQYPDAEQWHAWLVANGPLYVTIDGTPSHAIIVRGISGDGTADGTQLDILDPWDTGTTFDGDPTVFNPVNTGLASQLSVTDLNAQFNGGQLAQLAHYTHWRVLYHPQNAPSSSVAPSGSSTTPLQIRVRNRFKPDDTDLSAEASVVNAIFSRDVSLTGTGAGSLGLLESDGSGRWGLVITPEPTEPVPTDWANFPSAANAGVSRIFLEERATLVRDDDGSFRITGNDNVTLSGNTITATLRPLWIESPNVNSRPAGTTPDVIVVHHTNGTSDLPPHFVNANGLSPHYVVTRGDRPTATDPGLVIKLADEETRAWHAGASSWRGTAGANDYSIGIEVIHQTDPYLDEQYEALIDLLTSIRARYPAIPLRNVVGHGDVGTHPNGHLGRKLLDPGRTFDWPRLEAAGVAMTPATEADALPADPTTIYGGVYADAGFVVSAAGPQPAGYQTAVDEIRTDLTEIGYAIPGDATGDPFGLALGRAVLVFKYRYFTGAREVADAAFYADAATGMSVDFQTARMIKRVHHAATI
ncbi:N-acetylmuramoyl-L-alanine amidase [Zhihengliuella halotolerans]|uniref:N-acetylmuramoyl-L-alanine amidase n=1 Tax=Zhihengliuella halotolerans TaxID=370736 RepID=A0A4Q8ABC3_9MICC|nr:N-acetylmuramoyl-L-alanine amidase [Zhihengliuella halotolerans]RZU60833.1 papain like cysteine protease AvrRpt2 [Zhihengliuella halotolerans]